MSELAAGCHADHCAKAHDHSQRCDCHLASNYPPPGAVKPLWDPAYAELVAARNAGIKIAGKPALLAAYRARQGLAALCDCTAETTTVAEHAEWCAYRRSAERPAPIYDEAAHEAWRALWADPHQTTTPEIECASEQLIAKDKP